MTAADNGTLTDPWSENPIHPGQKHREQPSNATIQPVGDKGVKVQRCLSSNGGPKPRVIPENSDRIEALEAQIRVLSAKMEEMERGSFRFPSVVSTPNVCGGSPRLIRTRIPIWVLQQMRQIGFSESKILESYPTLTVADLAQAWGYVAVNKVQIDKEIEENERY